MGINRGVTNRRMHSNYFYIHFISDIKELRSLFQIIWYFLDYPQTIFTSLTLSEWTLESKRLLNPFCREPYFLISCKFFSLLPQNSCYTHFLYFWLIEKISRQRSRPRLISKKWPMERVFLFSSICEKKSFVVNSKSGIIVNFRRFKKQLKVC